MNTKFPENLQQREDYIFNQVATGNFEAMWSEITCCIDGKIITLRVMEDALLIDNVRVNVSATLSQKIADLFDASLPTAMVADMMYAGSIRKINPCIMKISTTVSSMVAHSSSIDKQINSKLGLASTVGKHWILDKKIELNPKRACNYGWHFTGPSYKGIKGFPAVSQYAGVNVKVIQPNAIAHDKSHSDYSQICQLVSQQCWIDNKEHRFSDLLKDPVLSNLISHTGALKFDRQPGTVPYTGCKISLPIRLITTC